MTKKIRFENGEPSDDRSVECPACGTLVPQSKLDEHQRNDCPEAGEE